MQFQKPKHYVAPRFNRQPFISGLADDPIWETATWSDEFVNIEGEHRPSPLYSTRFKLAWDDTHLYVVALMEEPHIWATYTEHDSIVFEENDFEIFLNPTGDHHSYYEWEVNALGTTFDLFMVRPYLADCRNDNSWEIPGLILEIAHDGSINDPSDSDSGWMVEAAFPLSAFDRHGMKEKPSVGDVWRSNFSRVQWKLNTESGGYEKIPDTPEDNWVWSPQGVIDMHRPWKWGYVQFGESAADAALEDVYWREKQILGDWFVSQIKKTGVSPQVVDWSAFGVTELGDNKSRITAEDGAIFEIDSHAHLKRIQ